MSWDESFADRYVKALYGGFAGEPFTGESREYVFVARRRAAAR
jgi:hypothetical protein